MIITLRDEIVITKIMFHDKFPCDGVGSFSVVASSPGDGVVDDCVSVWTDVWTVDRLHSVLNKTLLNMLCHCVKQEQLNRVLKASSNITSEAYSFGEEIGGMQSINVRVITISLSDAVSSSGNSG